MTPAVAMDERPGGPTAKRQPSPEGLGNRSEEDPSAVGAALNRCVIRSEAEGSTVQSFGCNEFVIPTGEIMGVRPISANLRGSFSSKLPQNRHPERSAHRFIA